MRIITTVVVLLVPPSLLGATYMVKAGGGDHFPTIQACANVAEAGDTCSVHPGTYNENVTVPKSGSFGSPIIFQAATSTRPKVRRWTVRNRAYVTITGFEITHDGMTQDNVHSVDVTTTDHVRIENNYIHDTTYIAIRANSNATDPKASSLYVGGNTITSVGRYGGRVPAIVLWADSSLVESNDISHAGDFTRIHGRYNVIRNNIFHDNTLAESAPGDHIDGWQSYCIGTIPAPEAANYTLLEGNYQYATPDLHRHFALINGTATCGGTTGILVRYNIAYDVGSSFYSALASTQGPAYHHKVYNNTVINAPNPADHVSTELGGITTGAVMNNIFYNAAVDSAPYEGYHLKSGDSTSKGDYNLLFFPSGPKLWSAPITSEAHPVLNTDPIFVKDQSHTFKLQAGSPARNAGGPLTSVAATDSGTGMSLVLNDAHFFQDGWAGVDGDWIRIGTTVTAQISAINYSTNTVTLTSSITRAPGAPVYLYKDSSGRVVLSGLSPDIGAQPFLVDTEEAPMPPTNLTANQN